MQLNLATSVSPLELFEILKMLLQKFIIFSFTSSHLHITQKFPRTIYSSNFAFNKQLDLEKAPR